MPHELTELLQKWSDGDRQALEQLTPQVYRELRRLAARYMADERHQSLQATGLINEAYVRLIEWKNVRWQNRAHFFAVSAQLMRRILIDEARKRRGAQRGGALSKTTFDEGCVVTPGRSRDRVELDEALKRLEDLDSRKSRVIELRYFGGLSVEETAVVLDISHRTVEREWTLAKAWLYRELT